MCAIQSSLVDSCWIPFLNFALFPSFQFVSILEAVMLVTSDGRVIMGKFVGHDQVQNVILKEAEERIFSADDPVERVPLGLYVVRGDSLCLIGEFDAAAFDDDEIRVPQPLTSIQQQQQF